MRIINGKIITPDAVLTDSTLVLNAGKITAIEPTASAATRAVLDRLGPARRPCGFGPLGYELAFTAAVNMIE